MVRPLRLEFAGALYHFTARGDRQEPIFLNDNCAAVDGKPTANANKLDFELTQRDMGLKELPKLEQIYDFSLLDELGKR